MNRFIKALIVICISVTFSGCWGQKDINELSLVNIIGIDKLKDNELKVSVIALTPLVNPQSQSINSDAWIGSATGSTIEEAIRNLNGIATKKLAWFHNKYIILSDEVAKSCVNEVADFLSRDRQTRYTTDILITEGKVSDLLQVPADVQGNLVQEIDGMVKNATEWSKAYVPDLRDFLSRFSENDTDNLVGRIGYYMSSRDTYSSNREEKKKQYWIERPFGIATIEGSSVLKGNKFVGFLSGEETRGILWLMNKVENASITVSDENNKRNITMDVITEKTKIVPELIGNKVIMKVKLIVKGSLAETTRKFNSFSLNIATEYEKLMEEQLTKEMDEGISKLQSEYDADVVGFKDYIKRKYPSKWRGMEQDWSTIFPTVEMRYDVNVTLGRFGEIANPLYDKNDESEE